MALNKNQLKNAIVAAMRQAKDEGWTEVQVADAWAKAIDDYVRAAVVKNVKVDITNGQQTGAVPLE
jgi:hypothetical protein